MTQEELDKEKKKEYKRNWYIKNDGNGYIASRKKERQRWAREYKAERGCARCPEKDGVCLEFHHIDPTEKDSSIVDAIKNGWSKERLLKEMEKCIVLCANCHRKEHAKDYAY